MPGQTVVSDEQIEAAILAERGRLGRMPGAYSVRRYCREHYGAEPGDLRIREAVKRLEGVSQPQAKAKPEPLPDFHRDVREGLESDRAEIERLRKRLRALEGEYQKAVESAVLTERLARDVLQAAPLSYSPIGAGLVRRAGMGRTPVSKVLMLSDTHVGKAVSPEQTLGFGGYDLGIFLDRLVELEAAASDIIERHTANPVDELVIAMLGDMLDGALGHGNEADQLMTLFDQWFTAAHALAQFVRNMAARVPQVRIYTAVGNHTRWVHQRKMPTANRYSNLDHFLYHHVAALTRDVPNVRWQLDKQPFAVFDVQGWRFFAGHGDHLKGGDRALGIPAHAINRQVNTQTQLAARGGQQAPHYYLFGHFHKTLEIPHGLGEVVINGSFVGPDGYSLTSNFTPVDPSQTLFEVHPKYGRTGIYPLKLQHAKPGQGAHYLEALDRV